MAKFIITIDGPAGSGKSTVARRLAERIGARFLDTGAMYRAVTAAVMKRGVDVSDEEQVLEVLEQSEFKFVEEKGIMKVFVDGSDFTDQIREEEVTENVRYVADSQRLRGRLVELQRDFAVNTKEGLVTEGRDQGTVAFGDAGVKFYLTADVGERARRRFKELQEKGCEVDLEQIKKAIEERDITDMNRRAGPLRCADDAVVVDTTELSIDGVVEKLAGYIKNR